MAETTKPDHFGREFEEASTDTQFGRYKLLSELGRGGMGVVYEAQDPNLKRRVALKILSQPLASAKERERFMREASLMARLNHQHIVKIFDIGVEQGKHYFTMELVDGISLAKFLQDNHPLSQQLRLLILSAQAVHYAHEQGIIHRDLKPSNIMITKDSEPKVMDFGLAKEIGGKSQKLSKTNDIVGTPEYMSPEQTAGRAGGVDRRTDVYSLGVVLYEMLTGHTPFSAPNPMAILYKISFVEPKPPSDFYPRLSKELEAICLKAMEKDKTRRYQTALEFAEDLARFVEGKATHAKPLTPLIRSWKWVRHHLLISSMTALVIVLTLALIVGLMRHTQELSSQTERLSMTAQSLHITTQSLTEKNKELVASQAQEKLLRIKAETSEQQAVLVLSAVHFKNREFREAHRRNQSVLAALKEFLKPDPAASDPQTAEYQELQVQAAGLKNLAEVMHDYCLAPHIFHTREIIGTQEPIGKLAAGQRLIWWPKDYQILPCLQPTAKLVPLWDDKTRQIVIWNLDQAKAEKKIFGPACPKATAISMDGRLVAWGGVNDGDNIDVGMQNLLTISETSSNRSLTANLAKFINQETIERLRFSPDGKWLIVATEGFYVLWDIGKQAVVWDREHFNRRLLCVFSQDSKWLAMGMSLGIHFLQLDNVNARSQPIQKLNISDAFCFGPLGRTLIFGDVNDIRIQAIKDGEGQETVTIANAHLGKIKNLALTPDEDFLVSVGEDSRVVFWNTFNYKPLWVFEIEENISQSTWLCFHDQDNLISINGRNAVYLWNWEYPWLKKRNLFQEKTPSAFAGKNMSRHVLIKNRGADVARIAISSDKQHVAVRLLADLHLWDLAANVLSRLGDSSASVHTQLAFNKDNSRLSGNNRETLFGWSVATRQRLPNWPPPRDGSTDGPRLAGCLPHSNLFVTEQDAVPQKSLEIRTFNAPDAIYRTIGLAPSEVMSPTLNASGTQLAFTVDRFMLNVWDIVAAPSQRRLNSKIIPPVRNGAIGSADADTPPFYLKGVLCFARDKYLAIGNVNGDFLIYDWQFQKLAHHRKFPDIINQIWYDPKADLYWIHAGAKLYIYPWVDGPLAEIVDRIFPLSVHDGYPILAVDISQDFEQVALFLQSGDICLAATKLGR